MESPREFFPAFTFKKRFRDAGSSGLAGKLFSAMNFAAL
jgi:hypothetical protein